MILLHFPPFLVDCDELVSSQGGITGHQIAHSGRAICVCAGLTEQIERERYLFQIDDGHCVFWQVELVQSVIATMQFVLLAKGDLRLVLSAMINSLSNLSLT